MKQILRFWLLAWLLAGSSMSATLSSLLHRETLVSLEIKDFPALVEAVLAFPLPPEEGAEPAPLGEWIDETFAEEDGGIALAEVIYEGEPLTLTRLLKLFGKEAVIGFRDFEEERILLAFQFGGNLALVEALQRLDRDEEDRERIEIIEQNHLGHPYFIEGLRPLPPGTEADEASEEEDDYEDYEEETPDEHGLLDSEYWAFLDGVVIEASTEEDLKDAIASLTLVEANETLVDEVHYHDAVSESGAPPILLFANLTRIVPKIIEEAMSESEELPPNPLGITRQRLLDALKLENLESAFVGVSPLTEQPSASFGMTFSARDGILSLLTAKPSTALEWPNYFPAEVVEAHVGTFDVSAFWLATLDLLRQVSPNFGDFYQMQLDNVTQQSGINFDEAILRNFLPGVEYVAVANKDDPENAMYEATVALPLRDAQKFGSALKTLVDLASQGNTYFDVETLDDGTSLYLPREELGESPIAGFAATSKRFVMGIGSTGAFRQTLMRMASPEPSPLDATALEVGQQEPVIEATLFEVGALMQLVGNQIERNASEDSPISDMENWKKLIDATKGHRLTARTRFSENALVRHVDYLLPAEK